MLRVTCLMIAMAGCIPMMPSEPADVQQLCVNPQRAYESGYNAGQQRHELDTRWVDARCSPEMRQSVRNAYLDGYHKGAATAPTVVTVPAAASSPARSCRFDSDCGEGYSCRSWRDDRVCMGYGDVGAPCWFDSDCLSGSCNLSHGARTCD